MSKDAVLAYYRNGENTSQGMQGIGQLNTPDQQVILDKIKQDINSLADRFLPEFKNAGFHFNKYGSFGFSAAAGATVSTILYLFVSTQLVLLLGGFMLTLATSLIGLVAYATHSSSPKQNALIRQFENDFQKLERGLDVLNHLTKVDKNEISQKGTWLSFAFVHHKVETAQVSRLGTEAVQTAQECLCGELNHLHVS